MTWPLVNYTPRLPSIMCPSSHTKSTEGQKKKNFQALLHLLITTNVAFRRSELAAHRQPPSTCTKKGDRLRPHYRPACLLLDSPAAHTALTLHHLFVYLTPSQNCDNRLLASSRMSVRQPTCNNSAPTGRISVIKSDVWEFFENRSRKIQVSLTL